MGPGVPADVRSELFEPFVTTKEKHLGVGLALARESVRDVGGDIVFESTSGSLFTVVLPTETSH